MEGGGKAVDGIFFDCLLTIYSQLFDKVVVRAVGETSREKAPAFV